jgi:glycerate kinase
MDGAGDLCHGLYFIFAAASLKSKQIMHVLIAPNAFKNALSAADAARYIHEGLEKSSLQFTSTIFPVGDGGDGTGRLLIEKTNASLISANVSDPLGRKINASFGLSQDGSTAIIELANASGLRLMKPGELSPLHASSFGAGELMKIAMDKKANCILLCIGGSATIDGGTGILRALGIRFLDSKGYVLENMPESLAQLETIDSSHLDDRIKETEIILCCDVKNTLLGDKGAAAVFGPQKGATPGDISKLENCLTRLRDVTFRKTKKDMATLLHGGASGGVAAGLAVFLEASLVNGIDYFLDYTDFDSALQNADLVITGEGSIDEQTLQGKAPFGVAMRAKKKGIPVIGLAGKVPLAADAMLQQYFDILLAINNEPVEMEIALKHTPDNLVRTAKAIGDLLALKAKQK